MKRYSVLLTKKSRKFLYKLTLQQQIRIASKIDKLENIEQHKNLDIKPIKSSESFRLRVWDYRIIFTKNDSELVINIIEIGNRWDIYKK